MKKHITLVLFLLVAILALASCGCQRHTHFPSEAVKENEVPATCTNDGSYDSVVYCTVCKTELSRNKITVPKTEHNYVGGVCTDCGEADPSYVPETPNYSEGLKFTSNGDGTCSVSGKGSCTDTDIVIPPISPDGYSVTSIGNMVFDGCSSLTSIVIPDSVTSIGDYAFYNCSSLESVVIGDGVTSIGSSAFVFCSSLKSVVIGDSVTSIGRCAFYNCSSLTSVEIPDSVTSIGNIAFQGCSSLTSVEIPDSVESIGNWAFEGCTSLTSVVIGDSVTSIGDWAFYDCSSLESIVIGDSVTSIGIWAFAYCSSLTDVYYTGTEAEWASISIGSSNSYLTGATIHYNYVPEE